jgi:nucleotide-binding universal stress UspA family protein
MDMPESDKVIRVAVDGSAGSRRALEWALDEARLRSCAVELVHVYAGNDSSTEEAHRRAEDVIEAMVEQVAAAGAHHPQISWEVVRGEAAEVLVRASEHSQLLVLGGHDLTGLRHSSQPSAADLCIRMAACPVVVVPIPHEPTTHSNLFTPV